MNKEISCSDCGAMLYRWDKLIRWYDGSWLCEECFDAAVSDLSRDELAERLGCAAVYAEELKS